MSETANQYQRLAPSPAAQGGETQAAQASQQQTQVQLPFQLQQVAQTAEIKPRYKYKKILYDIGLSEVVLGSVCVLFGFVAIIIAIRNPTYTRHSYGSFTTGHYFHAFTYVSQGIWCGAFLVVTGILGIKAKTNPSACMYNANMAMSIVTAIFMLPLTVLSGMAAGAGTIGFMPPRQITSLTVLHSILAIIGFAAAILCIFHSAYCCAGVCCRQKSYHGPVTYAQQQQLPYSGPVAYAQQQYGVNQPQHMIQLANGQYMLVANQPLSQAISMVGGQVIYQQPPQYDMIVPQGAVSPQAGCNPIMADPEGVVIMSQTTMSGVAQLLHETTEQPSPGSQQQVQVTTVTNALSQGPTDVPHPTSVTLLARDINKDQPQ